MVIHIDVKQEENELVLKFKHFASSINKIVPDHKSAAPSIWGLK
ncbi:hypothetical protein [Belliella alkalica]|nr:hypothetical protein [Belliella alkalica]